MITGAGLVVPDGSRPPLPRRTGELVLPEAPEPHPNVIFVEGSLTTCHRVLTQLADSLRMQSRVGGVANRQVVMWSIGSNYKVRIVVNLFPTRAGTRAEFLSTNHAALLRVFATLREQAESASKGDSGGDPET